LNIYAVVPKVHGGSGRRVAAAPCGTQTASRRRNCAIIPAGQLAQPPDSWMRNYYLCGFCYARRRTTQGGSRIAVGKPRRGVPHCGNSSGRRVRRLHRKPQAASRKPQAASRKPQAASRKPQAIMRKMLIVSSTFCRIPTFLPSPVNAPPPEHRKCAASIPKTISFVVCVNAQKCRKPPNFPEIFLHVAGAATSHTWGWRSPQQKNQLFPKKSAKKELSRQGIRQGPQKSALN